MAVNENNKYSSDMNTKQKIEEILLNDFGCFDNFTVYKLLDLLSVSYRTSPDTYSGEDLHKVPFGLYEIFWKSGGSSLASVGNMHDGVRWIAPINWTSADSPTGRMDKHAASIERMVLLYGR